MAVHGRGSAECTPGFPPNTKPGTSGVRNLGGTRRGTLQCAGRVLAEVPQCAPLRAPPPPPAIIRASVCTVATVCRLGCPAIRPHHRWVNPTPGMPWPAASVMAAFSTIWAVLCSGERLPVFSVGSCIRTPLPGVRKKQSEEFAFPLWRGPGSATETVRYVQGVHNNDRVTT